MSEEGEELDAPDTGAVFTFGRSRFADNAPSKFWIKRDQIILVACGDEHTAVVTQTGRLFTFGSNEWGQLGLGHANSTPRPSCVKTLKGDRVMAVSCGRSHTVVSQQSGSVMVFGSNNEGQLGVGRNPEWTSVPMQLEGLGDEVDQLAAGASHTLALTQSGQVFVWGGNTEGQLGLGEDAEENIYFPVLLPINKKVSQISCGDYHSCLVTRQGEVYTWGEAEGGKLGLGEGGKFGSPGDMNANKDSPSLVNLPEKVSQAVCGNSHTVALTQSGRLYSWGTSSHGQLGLGTRILESSTPHPIRHLANVKIVSVSCGDKHSVCVSESGQLYAWGDGRHGKLCLDLETTTNHFSPVYVARFSKYLVKIAVCGGSHTMVMAIPGYEHSVEEEERQLNEYIREEVNADARQRRRSTFREEGRPPPRQLSPLGDLDSSHLALSQISPNGSIEKCASNNIGQTVINDPEETTLEAEPNTDQGQEDIPTESLNPEKNDRSGNAGSSESVDKTVEADKSLEANEVVTNHGKPKDSGKQKTGNFLSGLFGKKKKAVAEVETEANPEPNLPTNEDADNGHPNDQPEKETNDEEQGKKAGKRVSFFRQFSVDKDDPGGGKGLKNMLRLGRKESSKPEAEEATKSVTSEGKGARIEAASGDEIGDGSLNDAAVTRDAVAEVTEAAGMKSDAELGVDVAASEMLESGDNENAIEQSGQTSEGTTVDEAEMAENSSESSESDTEDDPEIQAELANLRNTSDSSSTSRSSSLTGGGADRPDNKASATTESTVGQPSQEQTGISTSARHAVNPSDNPVEESKRKPVNPKSKTCQIL